MKRLIVVLAALLAIGGSAFGQGQNFPGSGSSSSGALVTFSLASFGAVDDDATDNCANGSIGRFTAAVNAYSGPGVPNAIISPTGANTKQTYKLATAAASCTFAFERASGVAVYLWANIDCAQAAHDCMHFGQTGQVAEINAENYTLDGSGRFLGGASLTGGTGPSGVYIEPGVTTFRISHVGFGVSDPNGGGLGFGANSTMGNCSNWGIYVDNPVAAGSIDHTLFFANSSDTSHGSCGYANPNGAAAGTNTVYFESNIVGSGGAIAGGTQCGSQGILDGGSLGASSNNNVYGFGVPFRVQGFGHRFIGNQGDSAGCSANGVSAIVHVGAAASSTAVGPITLDGNTVQVIAGHTTNFLAIAGDSTATMFSVSFIGNQNISNGLNIGLMVPAGLGCTANAAVSTLCQSYGNAGLQFPGPSGTTQTGWATPFQGIGAVGSGLQSANLGSTLLLNSPTSGRTFVVFCEMAETVRDAVSSTLPACVVSYTDIFSGAATSQTITATNAGNTVGLSTSGFAVISVTAGNPINISTTGYLSNTGAAMKYQLQAFINMF